ncbi:hypothetical protein COO60DRAFT_1233105 [Scenedesmus sp. NREL 46B-D3]|nr:hypothetical protein COO60DRAFT_1233105 [Scenedesmus sp. NREL 46B-D3]
MQQDSKMLSSSSSSSAGGNTSSGSRQPMLTRNKHNSLVKGISGIRGASAAVAKRMRRPRKGFSQEAQNRWRPDLNYLLLESQAAFSTNKHCFSCRCTNSKHIRLQALQTVSRGDACFQCNVCSGKGSSYEKQMYGVLDQEAAVVTYAVEAAAMGRRNNRGDKLADRQAKDQALADAALADGFSVMWLHPGDANDVQRRTVRWSAAVLEAVQHVAAKKKPQLFER